MNSLFKQFNRGPAVVIDDRPDEPVLRRLLNEIKRKKLPLIKYTSIQHASEHFQGLSSCNFIILDWKFDNLTAAPIGVAVGTELVDQNKIAVIEFIKKMQDCSSAPIFIFSAENTTDILGDLAAAGVSTTDRERVFVARKDHKGSFVKIIDRWIRKHPHIYLAKWWTNTWQTQNTKLFWQLFESDPNWPVHFFKAFEKDGVDGKTALIASINQMIFSNISSESLDERFLKKRRKADLSALKLIYKYLLYSKVGIGNDVRPGDIFFKDNFYYLNIRPECDTTMRVVKDHDLYVLKGTPRKAKNLRKQYNLKYGFLEKESEIILFLLEGHDIVLFNKKELIVFKYSDLKDFKVCRLADAFVTKIRHSFAGYIGRFGVPHYPTELTDSIFKREIKPPAN
jgi:hypothetical protein